MNNKILLLLDNSVNAIPFMLAARKMGYFVITTGLFENEYAQSFANLYIKEDYKDFDKISYIFKKYRASAISCGTHDDMSYTASYIDNKYQIGGHDTLDTIKILHLKDKFKEFTRSIGVHTPLSYQIRSIEEAKSLLSIIKFPMILKPVDKAGGKGVIVINNEQDYLKGITYSLETSINKTVLVEQFVAGTLHSFTTFIHNQKVVFHCSYDDYSYLNKYMTNSGVVPATHNNRTNIDNIIIGDIEKMSRALNLVDGLFHLQYIIDENDNPHIIEVMRRAPGNWSTSVGSISTGLNIDEWIIRSECGQSLSFLPPKMYLTHGLYGYHTILGQKNGIFNKVVISNSIKENVFQYFQWNKCGHEITNYLYDKVGVAFLWFPSTKDMETKMKRINELIYIQYF